MNNPIHQSCIASWFNIISPSYPLKTLERHHFICHLLRIVTIVIHNAAEAKTDSQPPQKNAAQSPRNIHQFVFLIDTTINIQRCKSKKVFSFALASARRSEKCRATKSIFSGEVQDDVGQ